MPSSPTRSVRLSRSVWAGLAVVAAGLWLLARGLPPDTFFVGDPGVKLIAARQAIEHPTRPLEVPLPTIGGRPAPFVDPFFEVHGDHSHAVTSELFPLVSAPFIALFGVRGAYILPAVGFLTSLAAWAWIGVLLDSRRSGLSTLLAAAFATPWLFYGLEFWEHAPAVGVAAAATALFLASAARTGRSALAGHTIAGGLFGASVLLRPEAAWYFAAVLLASGLIDVRRRWAAYLAVIVGLTAAVTPLVWYTFSHFGALRNPHVVGNAAQLGQDYLSARVQLLRDWFVVPSRSNAWSTAPGVLVALAPLSGLPRPNGRGFLLAACGITALLVVLTAPNDGGGQWGPRYLLFAFGPLTVLVADAAESLARRRGAAALLIILVATGCLWMQRRSYRELRGTKQIYERILEFVRREVPPRSYVITDLWWLDQVAADVTADRTFLYTPDPEAHAAVLDRLRQADVRTATVIRSREESSPRFAAGGACFAERASGQIPERTLTAIALRNDCAPSMMSPAAR